VCIFCCHRLFIEIQTVVTCLITLTALCRARGPRLTSSPAGWQQWCRRTSTHMRCRRPA
jgi:hypothetical protein